MEHPYLRKKYSVVIIQLSETEFQNVITKAVTTAFASQVRLEENELLCRKDAAAYLKITLPTLSAWEKKGYVTATRLGSRVYFKKSSLIKPNY